MARSIWLLVLLAAVGTQSAVLDYTLELRSWVVDFQRPTVAPRVKPFSIPRTAQMQAFLANNSYPGPSIAAEVGDTVQVTVHNLLLMNQVSLQFDGLQVVQSPGPISAQGGTGVYTLKAPTPGVYQWHAESPVQQSSGLRGAIVISNSSVADSARVIILSDATQQPQVCFNGSGVWDEKGCPDVDKATLNGVWGDGSKTSPYAEVPVIQGHCYGLEVLGFSAQPATMFELSVDSHSFSLPDGTTGVGSIHVTPESKATSARICADQKPGEYTITYSYSKAGGSKKAFAATLKYL